HSHIPLCRHLDVCCRRCENLVSLSHELELYEMLLIGCCLSANKHLNGDKGAVAGGDINRNFPLADQSKAFRYYSVDYRLESLRLPVDYFNGNTDQFLICACKSPGRGLEE